MTWFGSDVVAVACILGGASVGGGATLALLNGPHYSQSACVVEAGADSHRIVITGSSGAQSIVVTPKVRVHALGASERCETAFEDRVMEIHLDDQLRHLDDVNLKLESMEKDLQLQLGQLDRALEFQVQARDGVEAAELQKRIEAELRKKLEAKVRK